MEVIIKGGAKEIVALVVAIQEWQAGNTLNTYEYGRKVTLLRDNANGGGGGG